MLKALEIVGFKSFADRTRFEFSRGVTVVVGPNGSGKSNVVDAIKWALGEQSVKSLRGHEMADVIFNGANGRKATNAAEVTLTFDNAKKLLPIDTPEVHITRRVYRSGEGEYLINRNPARLRDIRDLLAGTGMGTQAYSVIEQGKVDILLQSSARDRRVIFEEAAGISRFRLRKIEALRRLERVEQNLLRLSDIVDEVDNRLRGVRSQAGKARRYKELTDRLQELRTQVGQVDWQRLSERLATFENELHALTEQRDAATSDVQRIEADITAFDQQITHIAEQIREADQCIATDREQIAAAESTIEHERARALDLDQEITRYRRQVVAMSSRAGDLQQQLHEATTAFQDAEQSQRDTAKRLADAERGLTDVIASLDQLRGENEQRRASYMQQMRQAAALGNETSSLESQVTAASSARRRNADRIEELTKTLDSLQAELDELRKRREQLKQDSEEHVSLLTAAEERLTESKRQQTVEQENWSELRRRQSAATERAAVLDELVRRHEGVSDGVKEVLRRAADLNDSTFRTVCGLVADVFHVSIEAAPLVEIALGQAAQHITVNQSAELQNFLQNEANRLGGRVGFIWLDVGTTGNAVEPEIDLTGRLGVLGRGDRFVETEPQFASLAKRLLSRTWFVEKLGHAMQMAHSAGRGLRFVTLSGELLEPDGTLVVGPRNALSGLISRRSELRAIQSQLGELEAAIDQSQQKIVSLGQQIVTEQCQVERRKTEHQLAQDALADNRLAVASAEERRNQLDSQRNTLADELQNAERQHAAAMQQLTESQERRRQLDADLSEMESSLTQLGQHIDRLETQRIVASRETTEIKVELAKSEERVRNLAARMKQFEENRLERRRAIDEANERLAECIERSEASQRNILEAESKLAELYLRKESSAAQTAELAQQRESIQRDRAVRTSELQKLNGKLRKLEDRIHTADLAANEVRLERTALASRMQEDYGIDIASIEHDPNVEEQHQREEVQKEIEELRQKINGLGNVNLESLDELEQLEGRYTTLADQFRDLTEAKDSLAKIIERIDADSRRLFSETLETVKGHFQTLFRDLFGGGRADIVLEENVDILESGIEIVARPPGKEPRSISLLSGGEKTMTCVALLLSIFRSRPSPFCVLDEVDAALDEANIDRFTKVIQHFLDWTQFIIITHSKKTMTCANTIYGITMQESGISKQVSVRFEDVSDDGHIITSKPSGDKKPKAA